MCLYQELKDKKINDKYLSSKKASERRRPWSKIAGDSNETKGTRAATQRLHKKGKCHEEK